MTKHGLKRRCAALMALVLGGLVTGCAGKTWDICQVETTFVHQADNREYVQKNAVLVNRETGESWVFSSDVNSRYTWEKIPFSDKDRTGK